MPIVSEIEVLTLFVEDLQAARSFYNRVFNPTCVFEDEVSSVLKFGGIMVNLLASTEAPTLVAPAAVASPARGVAMLLTIKVDDVDAACAQLQHAGGKLLNGPQNRPWGRRTAAFADPCGHVWELAQEIA